MRRFVVAIVVAVAAVTVVVARTAPARADATEDAALVHLDRGIAAFNAKDFQRAHSELTAAHDLAPDKPNPYRWLALTEIQLGDCAAALPNIEGFLARVPSSDARAAEMTRWREFCSRPAPPPPPPRHKSLHERWWFWPAVGTAALVVTGAVVYGITATDTATLPPIRCDEAGCAR